MQKTKNYRLFPGSSHGRLTYWHAPQALILSRVAFVPMIVDSKC
jgi:hypothetical protein